MDKIIAAVVFSVLLKTSWAQISTTPGTNAMADALAAINSGLVQPISTGAPVSSGPNSGTTGAPWSQQSFNSNLGSQVPLSSYPSPDPSSALASIPLSVSSPLSFPQPSSASFQQSSSSSSSTAGSAAEYLRQLLHSMPRFDAADVPLVLEAIRQRKAEMAALGQVMSPQEMGQMLKDFQAQRAAGGNMASAGASPPLDAMYSSLPSSSASGSTSGGGGYNVPNSLPPGTLDMLQAMQGSGQMPSGLGSMLSDMMSGQTGASVSGQAATNGNPPGSSAPSAGANQYGSTQTGTGQSGTNQYGSTQTGTGQSGTNQYGSTQTGTGQSGTNQYQPTQTGTNLPGTPAGSGSGTAQSATSSSGNTGTSNSAMPGWEAIAARESLLQRPSNYITVPSYIPEVGGILATGGRGSIMQPADIMQKIQEKMLQQQRQQQMLLQQQQQQMLLQQQQQMLLQRQQQQMLLQRQQQQMLLQRRQQLHIELQQRQQQQMLQQQQPLQQQMLQQQQQPLQQQMLQQQQPLQQQMLQQQQQPLQQQMLQQQQPLQQLQNMISPVPGTNTPPVSSSPVDNLIQSLLAGTNVLPNANTALTNLLGIGTGNPAQSGSPLAALMHPASQAATNPFAALLQSQNSLSSANTLGTLVQPSSPSVASASSGLDLNSLINSVLNLPAPTGSYPMQNLIGGDLVSPSLSLSISATTAIPPTHAAASLRKCPQALRHPPALKSSVEQDVAPGQDLLSILGISNTGGQGSSGFGAGPMNPMTNSVSAGGNGAASGYGNSISNALQTPPPSKTNQMQMMLPAMAWGAGMDGPWPMMTMAQAMNQQNGQNSQRSGGLSPMFLMSIMSGGEMFSF